MPDDLTANTILLRGERHGHKSDSIQVGKGTSERVNPLLPNEELEVAQPKGVAVRSTAIFTGPEQPEKRHIAQVRDGEADVVGKEHGLLVNIMENRDWQGLDTVGRRVFQAVAA